MQKVYLLLRNNGQTGPFTETELLAFNLKPHDLIWIEGKSAGWYYPQEIERLRPHLSFLQNPETNVFLQPTVSKPEAVAAKKIFVSMPSATVIKEEVKPQAASMPLFTTDDNTPAFTKPFQPETAEVKTAYAKPLEEVETDYMNWAYQKKTAKKKPLFSKSGLVVLCLLSVALFATWKIANQPKAEEATVSTLPITTVTLPVSSAPESTVEDKSPAAQKSTQSSPKKEKGSKNLIADKANAAIKQTTVVKQQSKEPAVTDDYAKESGDHKPAPVVAEESVPAAEEKSEPATTEAPKKKKLRDKILDIFRKKPEEKTNEAKPAETDNGNRQSTRREAGSSLTQMVTVKFEIPNDWMMGIKGAKAMLTNKSSETVSKAVVEVRYYNDDNDLLDKKMVVFTNVKSKNTQTVSVPEHATATRLEYSVVSAVGAGEAVAKL